MSTKRAFLHLNSFSLAIVEKPAMVPFPGFLDDDEVLALLANGPILPLAFDEPLGLERLHLNTWSEPQLKSLPTGLTAERLG